MAELQTINTKTILPKQKEQKNPLWFLFPFGGDQRKVRTGGAFSASSSSSTKNKIQKTSNKQVQDNEDSETPLDPNNSENEPFGSHIKKPEANLNDIDDDIGHAVFVSWISVAATFAGVGIVGLILQSRTKYIRGVSICLITVAVAILLWALFVFFYFRRRHWTTWILGLILLFAVGTLTHCMSEPPIRTDGAASIALDVVLDDIEFHKRQNDIRKGLVTITLAGHVIQKRWDEVEKFWMSSCDKGILVDWSAKVILDVLEAACRNNWSWFIEACLQYAPDLFLTSMLSNNSLTFLAFLVAHGNDILFMQLFSSSQIQDQHWSTPFYGGWTTSVLMYCCYGRDCGEGCLKEDRALLLLPRITDDGLNIKNPANFSVLYFALSNRMVRLLPRLMDRIPGLICDVRSDSVETLDPDMKTLLQTMQQQVQTYSQHLPEYIAQATQISIPPLVNVIVLYCDVYLYQKYD